ncbi:MAG TPA: hypothetical protein VFP22_07215, partial [Candidatus Limnocylindrales bacterium]|nr:hypothetical protein [Candidatus Limnocylindrales bacterium]
ALPLVEVWSDGRILTAAPVDAIYPGPLVNPVAVRDVGAAGAAQIVAAIRAAGLDRPSTAGPGIPGDAGSDTFVVTLDGQTTTTRLSGNGPGGGRPGFPGGGSGGSGPSGGTDSGGGTGAGAGSGAPDAGSGAADAGSGAPDAGGASLVPAAGGSADPGSAAFALLGRLTDPSETWGSAAVQPSIYQPLGYRIFAAPGAPTGDATTAQSPVAWPLSTPLDAFGTPAVPDRGVAGLRQGAVVGADAATVGPVFAKATQSTPFTSAGKPWTLYVRELLPDELGG